MSAPLSRYLIVVTREELHIFLEAFQAASDALSGRMSLGEERYVNGDYVTLQINFHAEDFSYPTAVLRIGIHMGLLMAQKGVSNG